MRFFVAALAIAICTGPAQAYCPNNAPGHQWNIHSSDQAVGKTFLQKNLVGKRVRYNVSGGTGTERYNPDGTYTYRLNNDVYDAPTYRFYNNGVRCIAYASPRYDRYVVNGGKVVLINWQGGRYEGTLLK